MTITLMLVVDSQDVPYPTSFLSFLYLLICFFSFLTSVCAVSVLQPHYQILNYRNTGLYIMYIIVCFLSCLCSLCILCLCMLNVRNPTSGLRAVRNPC